MSCTTSLNMRRFLSLLASLAMLGCRGDVSGTYALVSFDGQELPYSFELFGTVTVTAGLLTLSDSAYEVTVTFADIEPGVDAGTFALGASNIIHFTSSIDSASRHPSAPPPPPPPPPGASIAPHWVPQAAASKDTIPSRPPPPAAPEDETQSETRNRFEGIWDGDQITITDGETTLVFRR